MSANELIPNHLTFHIFHHALIFPPERWPRGIVSFGIAVLEGAKMSSSKGNIVAINEAVKKYGADAVRLYLMSTAEPWQDLDWRAHEADAMMKNLERFYALVEGILELPEVERPSLSLPDRWMLSRLQRHIRAATEALDSFETRKAVQHVFFSLMQDLRWYTKRVKEGGSKSHVLKQVLDAWVRLLAPFAPHTCEELWHRMGGGGFVSAADWPRVDEKLVDLMAEFSESYLSRVNEDLGEVLSVVKLEKPTRICLYVAQDWKWQAYRMAIERVRGGKVDMGELIRTATKELGIRQYAAELAKFMQHIVQELRGMSQEQLVTLSKVEIDESQVLVDSAEFMIKQFGVKMVQVFKADEQARYDPQDRSRLAVPLRPAIYVE